MKKIKLDMSHLVEEYTRLEIEKAQKAKQYREDVLSGKIQPNLVETCRWNISDRH